MFRRSSLVWELFAANAVVLVLATLALLLGPVSVSSRPVLAEILVVLAGLAVMLAVDLAVLRRALGPLRELADAMGTVHAGDPTARPSVTARGSAEVTALAAAFGTMVDRLEHERRAGARRALAAQEDERVRIARELHDQLGQTVTAVTLQADRAAAMPDPIDRSLLEQISRTSLQALDDVRRIARELRPEALDDLGLGNALITLCRRMAAQGDVRILPALTGTPPLDPEVELVVYRIAQEAVTNALRHAEPARIDVGLSSAGRDLVLVVRDDGSGLPAVLPADSTGLSGMRERAELVGGELLLADVPGGGTEVRLVVPVSAP